MAGKWNEKLSDELKKLNTIRNPTPAQKSRIAALKEIKKGGNAPKQAQTPIQKAGDFIDPSKVAQTEIDLNRPNETNPLGSRTYNPDGSISDTYSQAQQNLLNAQQGTGTLGANVAGGLLGGLQSQGAYDASKVAQYMPQGSDAARQQTYDATYGMLTKDTARNKAREQTDLQQRLADQGIPVGSKLYNDQMQQFNTRYDDQELAARNQATLTGNTAFDQSFNQGQIGYQNQLGAYQSNYNMPASIATQLQGLAQVQAPQFGQGVQPVNLSGYYETETGKALKNRELEIAARQGGSSGSGRQPAAQTPNYPSMGGVAGAGVASNQQQRPGVAGTLGNAVVQGITAGAAGNLTK